ncbi:MAG: GNAT family N-acetyltransferase [Ktedonobacteraceae bacterium]|nr:GNAT family N-acetyltransferase [Ktedonobacteraceae bacterium]MBV9709840.1 GNAT family N-acetyltransferase [Ktedonobacteraceae bacterium]
MQRQRLVKKAILTETELAEIEQLTELCNRSDNLHMRLSFAMLRRRSGKGNNDFLYYEQDMLVGYLAFDEWGADEKEVVAMVHPDFRRKGIFSALLAAAREECQRRAIPNLLLICEQSSASGQECAKAIGARLSFSEHEMVLEDFQERYTFDERLSVREAGRADIGAIATVLAASFDDPEPLVTANLLKRFSRVEPPRIYLATFGEGELSCNEPVGTLRLDEANDAIGIYGFGVSPDYRGRGYGRQILEETIRTIRKTSQKPIMLDVETDNAPAIGLYKSCGFRIKTTYDYFNIAA